jgi:hypothetical protein
VDETGWRTAGSRRALWGAFTNRLAVYRIVPDRHEREARKLLGNHAGVVTSDRGGPMTTCPLERLRAEIDGSDPARRAHRRALA